MTSARSTPTSIFGTLGGLFDVLAFSGFAATMLAAPFLHGALAPETALVLRMSVLAVALLGGVGILLRGRIARSAALPMLALLVYMSLVAAGAVRSPYRFGSSLAALDALVAAAGFLLAATLVRSRARRTAVVTCVLMSAAAMAVLGALQHLGWDALPPLTRGRVSSLYTNPNHFAGLLDLAAPLALAFALFGRTWWIRAFAAAGAGLLYVNVGLTYSYGGWMAVGAGTGFLLLAWSWRGWSRHRSLLPSAGATLAVALAVAAGLYLLDTSPRLKGTTQQRVASVLEIGELGSFRSRRAIHAASFEMVMDRPWRGAGPGNFAYAIAQYRPERITRPGEGFLHRSLLHAMNDYLNVASAGGLPALLAFCLFWLLALVRAPRTEVAIRYGISAGLVAILLHGCVDGNLTYVTANAFLAFGLAGLLHGAVEVDARPPDAESPSP